MYYNTSWAASHNQQQRIRRNKHNEQQPTKQHHQSKYNKQIINQK